MGFFENAVLSFSCGRRKTEVFEYDDVVGRVKSIPVCVLPSEKSRRWTDKVGFLSSLLACIQLLFALLNLQADNVRKQLNILIRLLSAPVSRTGTVKTLN